MSSKSLWLWKQFIFPLFIAFKHQVSLIRSKLFEQSQVVTIYFGLSKLTWQLSAGWGEVPLALVFIGVPRIKSLCCCLCLWCTSTHIYKVSNWKSKTCIVAPLWWGCHGVTSQECAGSWDTASALATLEKVECSVSSHRAEATCVKVGCLAPSYGLLKRTSVDLGLLFSSHLMVLLILTASSC